MFLDIKVPSFNATLMGIVRGVADYYGLTYSDAQLYGLSGHAFMINIHDSLCASGPYCWKRQPFYDALLNTGIRMDEGQFIDSNITQNERNKIEASLISRLDRGELCGFVNLEYQLITGYDETGFITTQPWTGIDYPPGHLAFSSWQEFGKEIHVNFFTFDKTEPAPEKTAIIAGLRFARDQADRASACSEAKYHTGPGAFDTWITAVEAGHGDGHGNRWNGMVWAECRQFAARYCHELADKYPETASLADGIRFGYQIIADNLLKVSDKKLDAAAKIRLLREAKLHEQDCLDQMDHFIEALS
ncbi:MAG: hypothetical protein SCM11_14860 [Bacillota bacterium]|nr:hypothetical protein [Bacillota bacterium]